MVAVTDSTGKLVMESILETKAATILQFVADCAEFKDRNDQWQDRTEWHSIVAWQRLAEIVGEYVRKGSKLYIEGKLQTSTWEDKQSGERKYRTEIVARDIVLLGRGTAETKEALRGLATNLMRSRLFRNRGLRDSFLK